MNNWAGSFTVMESIFIISIVIIGGAGSFWGPVVGAAVLAMLAEALRFIGMPSSIAANMRQIIYGAATGADGEVCLRRPCPRTEIGRRRTACRERSRRRRREDRGQMTDDGSQSLTAFNRKNRLRIWVKLKSK